MSEFYVGQKVCCLNKEGWIGCVSGDKRPGPAFGDILQIRAKKITGPYLVLQFDEWPGEIAAVKYNAINFRPLPETNIEIFQAMLVKPKIGLTTETIE